MTILDIATTALIAVGAVCLALVSFHLTVGALRQYERTHYLQDRRMPRQA